MTDFSIHDFDYILPSELIAVSPAKIRSESRLLVATDKMVFQDHSFNDIVDFLNSGDLLVLNDSRVLNARIFGAKSSGGKIEILIERILNDGFFTGHIRSNKTIRLGLVIKLSGGLEVSVIEKIDGLFKLQYSKSVNMLEYLDKFGNVPLPPYITREAVLMDKERYQTVYARELGSVAAPTAGLHFTPEILMQLKDKGVKIAYVTLHVGSGTFKPVNVENIKDHKMHSEYYSVNPQTIDLICETQLAGRKVTAVGTTTLRVLETVAREKMQHLEGETDIFITPGFDFRVVDRLITNFHLPKSTLLMLVSAFIGIEQTKKIYQYAILQKYKFFSYGDAMLLECKNKGYVINE